MGAKNEQLYQLSLTGIIAAVIGYIISQFISKPQRLSPEAILTEVKKAFRAEAPVEGTWIQTHAVPFQKFALKTDVYYGGITRYEDDELVTYEFIADAKTGSILDVHRTDQPTSTKITLA
ncbi:PepSY domain-containing protein [Levilactobacillus bambusae]|uniref:PepSY domain-containing protein n=1 Tax=Levilactobacillus bambusae TaxID=2024736 RepID=A0A2V1N5J0_9LACO|nr:PepSY domain-containing protein [Levilactobacillus bambusae]PWG01045.1 hypothetical protein DCM90_02395 [Levilactobacillus bambusae]